MLRASDGGTTNVPPGDRDGTRGLWAWAGLLSIAVHGVAAAALLVLASATPVRFPGRTLVVEVAGVAALPNDADPSPYRHTATAPAVAAGTPAPRTPAPRTPTKRPSDAWPKHASGMSGGIPPSPSPATSPLPETGEQVESTDLQLPLAPAAEARADAVTQDAIAADDVAAHSSATDAASPWVKREGNGASAADSDLAWVGADYAAMSLHNPKPPYPAAARRLGHEGRVVLQVVVSRDGHARILAVARSSGHATLDRAAAETVARWRFIPARRAGVAVDSMVTVPVTFRLDQ